GVALELAKLHARVSLEQDLRGEVVLDLLNGAFSTPDMIAARVAQLGFDLAQPRRLILLKLSPANGRARPVDEAEQLGVRRRFRDLVVTFMLESPWSMVATDGELVAILAPAASGSAPPEAMAEALLRSVRAVLPELEVSAVIGDCCRSPADYAGAYRLARGALDAATRLGTHGRIVDTQSMGVARLIISAADREALLDFARHTLGPLLSGGSFERLLLATLSAYAATGFNQRETARSQYLHPNTVAYRLRKAEERLGIKLDEPMTRLDLSLALRIGELAELF
ncbi:MAG: helix-turn-helix domain-containing protein, partial [Chloroflexi bacterium]|nr:helix-turn-helix domain-containing protein [Chloroflexota bacterium]